MKCTACGNENPKDGQFCGGCGASLSVPAASGIGVASSALSMVSFREAVKLGFKNYFDFGGRSTRAEYWWFQAFIAGMNTILFISIIGWLVLPFFWLGTIIPAIAVSIRRLHDIGKSGWWLLGIGAASWGLLIGGYAIVLFGVVFIADDSAELATIIMILGVLATMTASMLPFVVWIRWCVRKSDLGPNKYDPDPSQTTSQQP